MKETMKRSGVGALGGAVGVLLLGLLALIFIAYTGSYNVAASEDHTPFTRWFLDTTFHNSVSSRAGGLQAPEQFSDEMIATGAAEYSAMCQHCHGAPGARKADWAQGMLPQPPHLPDEVPEWEPNEVFWLVKHGVKMSGMPAFGQNHDDPTLGAITAFVMQLPGMTPDTYTRLAGGSNSGSGATGGHAH